MPAATQQASAASDLTENGQLAEEKGEDVREVNGGINGGINRGINEGMNDGINEGINDGINGGIDGEINQTNISESNINQVNPQNQPPVNSTNYPPFPPPRDYTATPADSALPLPRPPDNPANQQPARTLWMGDIEAWWDEAFVAQLWAQLGYQVRVKVIRQRQQTPQQQNIPPVSVPHSGYCFVEFASPDDARRALALNGHPILGYGGKPLRLNWATGATLDSQIAQTPEYSLFVGDLSSGTTEAHLLALFQTHFDTVKTVRVMTDPATGFSRCFGFVRFTSEQDRNRALLEMNGRWLGGRPIHVALATPKRRSGHRRRSDSRSIDGIDQNNGLNQQQQFGSSSANQLNTTVFVGGLASTTTGQALQVVFAPFGAIISVHVPPGKGCGFVRFASHTSAENAISDMQGFVLEGSRLRLSWGRSSRRQRFYRQPELEGMLHQFDPLNSPDQQAMNGAYQSGFPPAGSFAPPPPAAMQMAPIGMEMFPNPQSIMQPMMPVQGTEQQQQQQQQQPQPQPQFINQSGEKPNTNAPNNA